MLMGLGPPAIKLGAKMTPEEVTALLKSLERPARKRKAKKKKEKDCWLTYTPPPPPRDLPRFDTLDECIAYAFGDGVQGVHLW